jgi:hypothetical protein
MSASFTLSLDCEGLWGMADQFQVVSGGVITQASLRQTYNFIAQTLDGYDLRCTAAFVTGFAAGPELMREHSQCIHELARIVPRWFSNILPAIEGSASDGWDGHSFFKQLAQAGHEMAWHGTTHLPLDDSTPEEAIQLELQLGRALLSRLDCEPTSIVFPRNRVGHLDMLKKAGFTTYRADRSHSKLLKLRELAREWHIFDKRVAEKPHRNGDWMVSPPGDFLNWPFRIRAGIPPTVTVMRWKSLLRAAVANGGYVHMWFHPHNLITAPAMKASFTAIIREVAQLARSGDIVVLTMRDAEQRFANGCTGAAA